MLVINEVNGAPRFDDIQHVMTCSSFFTRFLVAFKTFTTVVWTDSPITLCPLSLKLSELCKMKQLLIFLSCIDMGSNLGMTTPVSQRS